MAGLSYSSFAIQHALATRERARELRRAAAATRALARRARARSQAWRGVLEISGGSGGDFDPSLLVTAIMGTSLCEDCIARKVGIAKRDVTDALARMSKTLKIRTVLGRCEGCQQAALVSRLG